MAIGFCTSFSSRAHLLLTFYVSGIFVATKKMSSEYGHELRTYRLQEGALRRSGCGRGAERAGGCYYAGASGPLGAGGGSRHEVGGGTRSEELTLPGFVHDVCSAIHPLGVASPFFREQPLSKFGLGWVQILRPAWLTRSTMARLSCSIARWTRRRRGLGATVRPTAG